MAFRKERILDYTGVREQRKAGGSTKGAKEWEGWLISKKRGNEKYNSDTEGEREESKKHPSIEFGKKGLWRSSKDIGAPFGRQGKMGGEPAPKLGKLFT